MKEAKVLDRQWVDTATTSPRRFTARTRAMRPSVAAPKKPGRKSITGSRGGRGKHIEGVQQSGAAKVEPCEGTP